MPRQTPLPPVPSEAERIVRGPAIELPLVEWVAAVRSLSALRITWHAHQQFEMLFLLEGATAYEFADKRTVELPGGHFLIVPPGARHRGLHDVRRPATLCGILFDPRRRDAAQHTPFSRRDLTWLARECQRFACTSIPMNAELRRLVLQLSPQIDEVLAPQPSGPAALRLGVCATLLEAARQLAVPRTLEPTRAVQAAIDCIEARYAEPLSMDDVAQAALCSRARLFQIFKRSTGMTPNDYLQRLRVNRAQTALAKTSDSVTEVALACGFSTSQYFSNVFRKYAGVTPSEFRAKPNG
jgi:AraC-like DNA-binding protein